MCGIVGAISTRNIVPILVEGLKRLEYRGYDSSGIAVLTADAKQAVHVFRLRSGFHFAHAANAPNAFDVLLIGVDACG